MNRFEKVCENCPLRTKVDVNRASESMSCGSNGVESKLSDGNNQFLVTLTTHETLDSDSARAEKQATQERIKACDGPADGLLRRKCGAGLATSWRWAEVIGAYEPNISSPEEISPLLDKADYHDALPNFDESVWLVGSLRSWSEVDCGVESAFDNYGIKKLSESIRGTHAELAKGKAVMLDHVSWATSADASLQDVFRIRIAQAGPEFAFHSAIGLTSGDPAQKRVQDIEKIFAEGIYAFLFSDKEAIEQSEALIAAAEKLSYERYSAVHNYVSSGAFAKSLKDKHKK